jgi:hypothetical protein
MGSRASRTWLLLGQTRNKKEREKSKKEKKVDREKEGKEPE